MSAGSARVERVARPHLVSDGGPYTAIVDGDARATADRALALGPAAPLAGLTFAVKDLLAVQGQRLSAGSAVWGSGTVEAQDALFVARLRQLGAALVGTTALHEIAFGVTGINDTVGWPRNPHDPGRVPGGSSSGSAVAVVEGSADIGVGTDTGGSIRIPAALCGAVGFKPAYGTYPLSGVLPLAPSLDHVGVLACGVALIRRVHSALGLDCGRVGLPLRVGVVTRDLEDADSDVAERVRDAIRRLERAGASIVEVHWPDPDRVFAVSTDIMFSEAAAVHRSTFERMAPQYGEDVRLRLRQGLALPAADYAAALGERDRFRPLVAAVLNEVDCVVGPTTGIVAPLEADARKPAVAGRLIRYTRLANLVGTPALSLPLAGEGLPVGLQIMARDDAVLLGLAEGIEGIVR